MTKAERVCTATRLPDHPHEKAREMTDQSIPHADFYVYALLREDGTTPFYIGKGRGSRMHIHARDAHKGTTHKDRIIQRMTEDGHPVLAVKLSEWMTDREAKCVEVDMIRLLLRWPIGPLANLTNGGDGVESIPEESRKRKSAKLKAIWSDPEKRKKAKAEWTPERRKAHGIKMREKTTPEVRAKISASSRRYWERQPRKPKPPKKDQRAEIKAFWADPDKRAVVMSKRAQWIASHPLTDEQKMIQAARLNSPKATAKRVATNAIPEVNRKRVEAQRTAFGTPEAKAKRSEASKKMWAAKKAQKTAPDATVNASKP